MADPTAPRTKKLYIETVGCQMNLLDSELVVGKLRHEGYELTDDIDQAASYIFRGIVADSVRGLQFLLTRRELDPARVVVMGNDMALLTAARSAAARD